MNNVFLSHSAQSLQYRDRMKPEARTMPYSYRMTSVILYSAQYYIQHCTLHASEQLGAPHMHNPVEKHPTRLEFEFRATVRPNESSGPVITFYAIAFIASR